MTATDDFRVDAARVQAALPRLAGDERAVTRVLAIQTAETHDGMVKALTAFLEHCRVDAKQFTIPQALPKFIFDLPALVHTKELDRLECFARTVEWIDYLHRIGAMEPYHAQRTASRGSATALAPVSKAFDTEAVQSQ